MNKTGQTVYPKMTLGRKWHEWVSAIAFDIETTGFSTTDQLTVAGFDADIGSRVFLNADDRTCSPSIEQQVNEQLRLPVTLSVPDEEVDLLEAINTFIEPTIAKPDVKLIAYNGEISNDGFDLPFLRTRLIQNKLNWPCTGLPYIDVMEIFSSRFNTSDNSLTGVYEGSVQIGRFHAKAKGWIHCSTVVAAA